MATVIQVKPLTQESREEVKEKKTTLIWENVQQYSGECTLHGVGHVFTTKGSLIRRALWLCFFAACVTYCVKNLAMLLSRYSDKPISTKNTVVYPETMPFPAITICNFNRFLNSKYIELNLEKMGRDAQKGIFNPHAKNISIEEVLLSAGHNMSKTTGMLVNCTWNGKKCGSENFTSNYEKMGLCHTFNAGGEKRRPLKSLSAGESAGLKLVLNIQFDEYMNRTENVGLKIRIHDPYDPALTSDFGFAVMPGKKALVSVTRKEILSTPQLTGCRRNGKVPYSEKSCMSSCKTNYLISKCGCQGFPITYNELPVCTFEAYQKCYRPYEAIFAVAGRKDCDCLPSCDEIMFDTSISYALFNTAVSYEMLQKAYNTGNYSEWESSYDLDEFLKKNVVQLSIFYQDLSYHKVEFISAYPFTSFLAEAGGLIGMYFGASWLSMVEIVELLWNIITIFLPKKANLPI